MPHSREKQLSLLILGVYMANRPETVSKNKKKETGYQVPFTYCFGQNLAPENYS